MSGSGIGVAVRVGRFAGCHGQHTLASDEVRVQGFPLREHVLVRHHRAGGVEQATSLRGRWTYTLSTPKHLDAWIPLEHVELL